jgi:hypothetical protein
MDGYTENNIKTTEDIKNLSDTQIKINSELSSLTKELNGMKNIPRDIESWIDELSDFTKDNNFKMSDFSKMFKLTRQYDKLAEKQEINARKIKTLVIDDLLEKIKGLLKE